MGTFEQGLVRHRTAEIKPARSINGLIESYAPELSIAPE